ncbi:hypothetical protein SmJEL517_g05166 [Synchytrium microbalum]|uniref:Exocyst complex component Sec3 PIP2-binding N-terminal domain-containing protein n=1 Tax=Synchytrium microbalum TaxID=1806994 RepID=A0A507BQT6_9FUNG|nr:uncharacterized protein SmJEL517_g05166 [Synchytrium microbalum]TPX31547.1 hypothetical protein SmJEL517_g05166 [Synchytrium microbalum]
MAETALRNALTKQLFIGYDESSTDPDDHSTVATPVSTSPTKRSGHTRTGSFLPNTTIDTLSEKLLIFSRVLEERDGGKLLKIGNLRGTNNAIAGINSNSSANSKGGATYADDDDSKGKKVRYICITAKKNMKIRIHKVKQEGKDSQFTISKTWSLDDVRSLESKDGTRFAVGLSGKVFEWEVEDLVKKAELLYTLLKLAARYCTKIPKLVNINETALRNQLGHDPVFLNTAGAELKKALSLGSRNLLQDDDEVEQSVELMAPEEPAPPPINLDEVLSDFDWNVGGDAAALEARLYNELLALEAANVHAIIGSEDQASAVVVQIDKTLQELSNIEQWLAHYTGRLNSMGQDVHQIEMKNKGMQVVAANQKGLVTEMEKLLARLKLPGFVVEILKNEPLDDSDGIVQCENATLRLKKVIESKIDNGLNDMTAFQERITLYLGYANGFATRLSDHFKKLLNTSVEKALQDPNRSTKRGRLPAHDLVEIAIFKLRNLLLWLRDFDEKKFQAIQEIYTIEMSRLYSRDIQALVEPIRTHHLQKRTGLDEAYLFSLPTVSATSVATNAIKTAVTTSRETLATLKGDKDGKSGRAPISFGKSSGGAWKPSHRRKGTKDSIDSNEYSPTRGGGGSVFDPDDVISPSRSAAGLRRDSNASSADNEPNLDDKMLPDEAVAYVLTMLVPCIIREQNFSSDLFSLNKPPLDPQDPLDDTPHSASAVRALQQDEWLKPREAIPDVRISKKQHDMLEHIFDSLRDELFMLIDSGLKYDSTFAIGMMVRSESYIRELESTSYTFLMLFLEDGNKRLSTMFSRFVDDQIRAIDDSKVSRRRAGVLPSFKVFPNFVDRMENLLERSEGGARSVVASAYERIVKAMFDALDTVGKAAARDAASAADDKEQLNAHILTIENMHYFSQEIKARRVTFLDTFLKQARTTYDANLNAYVKVVIRKPLGKLLEFFEGIEQALKTAAPEEVSYRVQFNKNALKDVIKKYPGKEIKKGLEALYKRVDKHFSEELGLLPVVWRATQEEVLRRLRWFEELIVRCYPESGVRLDISIDDVLPDIGSL